MKVLKAAAMGMCFGVRAALDRARSVIDPTRVTLYGELVHNESLQAELRARGFASLPEGGRPVPSTPVVMVTAHGVSDRERQRLQAAGKEVLDTTCPLVRLAHQVALEAHEAGDLVVVVGRPGHVEVQGLVGDLDRFCVVWDAADVSDWGGPRIAVMAQTTTPPWHAEALVDEIRRRNPGSAVRFLDTICRPPGIASRLCRTCWIGSRPWWWSEGGPPTTRANWPAWPRPAAFLPCWFRGRPIWIGPGWPVSKRSA